jgi:branched-chain amino acid transport system substrate-binding protein
MSRLRTPRRAALAATLLLGLAGCGRGEAIVFGVAGPLQREYGASTRLGAELAQAEINAEGGINGRQIELRFRDDDANRERAIAVAEELYADPEVVAVVGHVNSAPMAAAAPVYDRGLPALAPSATSPGIGRLSRWVFRVASSDSANAVALARQAATMGSRIAVLYENDDYGRGLSESFRAALLASGGSVLEVDPYLEATEDLRPYLARLKEKGAELVFIAGVEVGASRIIQQAKEVGLGARFLGGDGLEGLVTLGPEYNGTLVGLLYHPDASQPAREFAEKFRRVHGRDPDSFAALGYDAVRLLARAAKDGGPSRGAVRDYLAGVGREGGSAAFTGATGTVRFDENGDPLEKGFAVGAIRDGRIELAAGGR